MIGFVWCLLETLDKCIGNYQFYIFTIFMIFFLLTNMKSNKTPTTDLGFIYELNCPN